ncbi:MAG TPA: heme o synthase [Verrucomicrobiae bacterium]|jgi:protoheme IX farnesyltransferase|nr:heme o synthase [Verrucomicrobiae bacterium]
MTFAVKKSDPGSGAKSVLLSRFADFFELTKPRLVALVLLSTAVGFFLASSGPFPVLPFFHLIAGTGFVAAGSLALNQWMERDYDAIMARTAGRPIPSRRVKPLHALVTGSLLAATGLIYLALTSHPLSVFLAAVTLFSYLFFYTPLKRVTSLNTVAGAFPGAVPPLIGWAGASGELPFEAWVLFSIMFLWQLPHFLAIAWFYREEYRKAGFVMLSVEDPDGQRVAKQAVLYSAMLLPVSLLPTLCGMTGIFYFVAAFLLGGVFLGISIASLQNLGAKARLLFATSIFYLSLLLLMMVIDKA